MTAGTDVRWRSEIELTVVIPAWDVGVELARAVRSAAEQRPRVAVVVVDNASTAPLEYSGAVTVRLERRVSLGAARNAGLAVVETPFVLFLDADDELLSGATNALAAALRTNPGAVMAVAEAERVDSSTGARLPRRSFPPVIAYRIARWPRVLAVANLARNLVPVTGSVAIRTSAARGAGGFGDLRLGQDWLLGAGLAFRGEVVLLRRLGSRYSVRPDSVTGGGRAQDFASVRAAIRQRARTDPSVPRWVRHLLPAIAVAQAFGARRRRRYARRRSVVGQIVP